jgi:hypothetical protein
MDRKRPQNCSNISAGANPVICDVLLDLNSALAVASDLHQIFREIRRLILHNCLLGRRTPETNFGPTTIIAGEFPDI